MLVNPSPLALVSLQGVFLRDSMHSRMPVAYTQTTILFELCAVTTRTGHGPKLQRENREGDGGTSVWFSRMDSSKMAPSFSGSACRLCTVLFRPAMAAKRCGCSKGALQAVPPKSNVKLPAGMSASWPAASAAARAASRMWSGWRIALGWVASRPAVVHAHESPTCHLPRPNGHLASSSAGVAVRHLTGQLGLGVEAMIVYSSMQ